MEKRPRIRVKRYLIPVVVILAILFIVRYCSGQKKPVGHPRDYPEIAEEGTLRVATEYNSISFYVDNDTISGFHYELIEAFARDQRLKVEITPLMSFEERLKGLSEGRFDVIAYGIPSTSLFKDSLLLTSPITLSKQVLVQRKENKNDSLYIRSQLELAGKTLNVIKGSAVILRIQNLGNEIGDTIYIKEIEKYGPEQLISLVAHGNIDYAVCDESIALAVADSFPQLDINTDISFTQFYSWGVSKQSPILLDSLNAWLKDFTAGKKYRSLYKKYYNNK